MSRRVWFAALFVVSLILVRPAVLPEITWAQPVVPNVEGPPSGATSPAPLNSSFDAEPSDAAKTSVLGKAGIIEPPGWQLAAGGARPVKTGGPQGRGFALLNQGQAVLVSSPFTLSPTTTKFSFSFRFQDPGSEPGEIRAFILSGADFSTETQVFADSCDCASDWRSVFVETTKWADQTIKVKFVRNNANGAAVGVADVASDLLQAKLGRDSRSSFAGDPVDTSNGNFFESAVDIPVIPGTGVPLQFSRYYNSNSTYTGNLGLKWTNTYSIGLTAEPDNSRTLRYADGRTANFTPIGGTPANPSPPVFDAATSSSASGLSLSWSHTTGSADNRILVVGLSYWFCDGVSVISLTYNGASMSQVGSTGGGVPTWYLLNPASGQNSVSVQALGSCSNQWRTQHPRGPDGSVTGMAMTFTNASQVAPPAAGSDCCSVTVNTTANDLAADFVFGGSDNSSPGSGQTARISGSHLGASTAPGVSPSVTMSWSGGGQHTGLTLGGTGSVITSPLSFSSPAGNFDSLLQNTDATYTLTTKSALNFNFTVAGLLTSISDRNGNTTTVSYDGSGNLSSVIDAGGRSLTFATSNGKLTSVTDPLGRVAYFNTSGTNLADTTDVRGGHTYFTYNSGGSLLLTKQNALGNQEFSNTYDSAGRVVKQLRVAAGTNTYTCFYYGTSPSYSDTNCPTISPAPASGETIVVDARGYKTKYAFDTTFRTYQVTDAQTPTNGVSTKQFDTSNNVTCVTDQLGNKTGFTYDSVANVTHVIDANNTNSSCALKSAGVQTSVTYNGRNDPTLVTDVLGRQAAYAYDSSGNLTQADSKDASSNVKLRTCFAIGGGGLVSSSTQSTTLTNCTGNTTGYSYDSYGNVTAITNPRFYGQGSPPQTTATYDLGGRKLTVTNELGHVSTFTYNNFNEVLTAKDNLNDTATFTYDAVGTKTTAKDALNNTTTFNYDNLNRLTSVVDPLSGTTSYKYDANDNRVWVTNAKRQAVSTAESGASCGTAGTGNDVDNDSDGTKDDGCPSAIAAYDSVNRLTSQTDSLGTISSLTYDLDGRVHTRTDGNSQTVTYTYDNLSRVTLVDYPTGTDTSYQYDAVSNRTQMVDASGTTTYSPDALNRPTSITFPGSKTVSYSYNNVGLRSRITYPDTKYVDYTYDAANNLSTVTDWLSKQTSYTYNNAGLLTTSLLPSSTGLAVLDGYDSADRLTSVKNDRTVPIPNAMLVASFGFASSDTWTPPSGMTEAFDVSSKAAPNSGGEAVEGAYTIQATAGASGTKTATAAGDADYGNAHLLALRPASGSSISFRAAASASVDSYTSLTINKPSGTAQGDVMIASIGIRPTSVGVTAPSGWTLVAQFKNEGNSNLLAVYKKVAGASEPGSYTWTLSCCSATASAGGIQSFSGVDGTSPIVADAGQTTPSALTHATPSIDTSLGGYSSLYEFAYALNADSNRTQVVDGTGTTSYSYDNLQRLTSVTYPGPATDSYTYDAVGNRTAKNSTSYTYNAADQLTSTGGVNYGYDSNGNQNARGSDSFAWDYENRLTSATVSGTQTTYTYNADGLRQTRASGGTTTSYVWDVTTGAMLQDGTNTYVYGLGLISTTDGSGNQTYYLKDGLGNTIALCNGSGTVTATYTYDVFGAVKTHTGGTTEFTFTGEDNDPNGLEYLRARYYDNATGRFLGLDPKGNGYGYAGANPVNRLDPTGLYTECPNDPVWGYICYDSTQVGDPACDPITGDCHIYIGDGSAPGNTVALLARFGNACAFNDGSVYPCTEGPLNDDDIIKAVNYADHFTKATELLATAGITLPLASAYTATCKTLVTTFVYGIVVAGILEFWFHLHILAAGDLVLTAADAAGIYFACRPQ